LSASDSFAAFFAFLCRDSGFMGFFERLESRRQKMNLLETIFNGLCRLKQD
jgi:hypothetical protein